MSIAAQPLSVENSVEAPRQQFRELTLAGRCWFVVGVALALAGLTVTYGQTFVELAAIWEVDPTYSHGYLVPFLCLGMGYWAWSREKFGLHVQVPRREMAAGLGVLVVGLVLHWFSMFVSNLFFDVIALILMLRGGLLMLGGQLVRDRLSFAVIFLIFMAPLPMSWYQPLAIGMQQFVSIVSANTLDVCGIPCYREGYFVHLPGYTMEVGEACSGLRQLTAVMALAAALGYFSRRNLKYRWTLFLVSLPIAVFANCIRVIISGLILKFFGRKWAEGVYHTLEGLIIVILAAGVLLMVAWLLAKLMPEADQSCSKQAHKSSSEQELAAGTIISEPVVE